MIRRLSLVLIAVAALGGAVIRRRGKTLDVESAAARVRRAAVPHLHEEDRSRSTNVEQEAVAVSVEHRLRARTTSAPASRESTLHADRSSTTLAGRARAAPTWSGTTPTRRPRSWATAGSTRPASCARIHEGAEVVAHRRRSRSTAHPGARRPTSSTSSPSRRRRFGDQPFETFETRTFTVTNVWSTHDQPDQRPAACPTTSRT